MTLHVHRSPCVYVIARCISMVMFLFLMNIFATFLHYVTITTKHK